MLCLVVVEVAAVVEMICLVVGEVAAVGLVVQHLRVFFGLFLFTSLSSTTFVRKAFNMAM